MNKIISIFLSLSLFCHHQVQAQESTIQVEGYVFLDKDQNNKFDKKERGLKNIPVSDGEKIVYTDAKGYYKIETHPQHSLFPILPSGYALSKDLTNNINNKGFLYIDSSATQGKLIKHNIGLLKQDQNNNFTIGAIGDIQVGDTKEVNYAGKSIFKELNSRTDIDFYLMLGDLVNDDLKLFEPMKSIMECLPAPSWTVIGNHDRNPEGSLPAQATFNQIMGASHYAFNYAQVHFIVLNNVFSTGLRSYEGRLTDMQLQFLENDLALLAENTPIVISQHIPMYQTRNKADILKKLTRFNNVLILSGHTHQVSRHFYNNGTVHEIVTGAPSGTWWRGTVDSQGIPIALMQCGSPRNYFTINFTGKSNTIQYKAIGLDSKEQIDITVSADTIFANVYAGSDSTQVMVQLNDGEWIPMLQTRRPAPSVIQTIEHNDILRNHGVKEGINPLRRRNSPHIWQLVLHPPKTNTVNKIRVIARDNYGLLVEDNIVIHQN